MLKEKVMDCLYINRKNNFIIDEIRKIQYSIMLEKFE